LYSLPSCVVSFTVRSLRSVPSSCRSLLRCGYIPSHSFVTFVSGSSLRVLFLCSLLCLCCSVSSLGSVSFLFCVPFSSALSSPRVLPVLYVTVLYGRVWLCLLFLFRWFCPSFFSVVFSSSLCLLCTVPSSCSLFFSFLSSVLFSSCILSCLVRVCSVFPCCTVLSSVLEGSVPFVLFSVVLSFFLYSFSFVPLVLYSSSHSLV